MFAVFTPDEKLEVLSHLFHGASLMAWYGPFRTSRRKQEVIVVKDSPLQGMKISMMSFREVCCMLGFHIWVIVEKLPRHI